MANPMKVKQAIDAEFKTALEGRGQIIVPGGIHHNVLEPTYTAAREKHVDEKTALKGCCIALQRALNEVMTKKMQDGTLDMEKLKAMATDPNEGEK